MTKIRDAYELIRDSDRWTTRYEARDAFGRACDPLSERAVRWCAVGAVVHVGINPDEWSALTGTATRLFKGQNLVYVNDRFGHEAVMQVFEKTIVELEGSL